MDQTEMKQMLESLGAKAKSAARKLATATTEEKNKWLAAMADAIDASEAEIIAADKARSPLGDQVLQKGLPRG